MTEAYYPFDGGPGFSVTEDQWAAMAQLWLKSGVARNVLNSLAVFADSTGMQVKVPSGVAFIEGYYYKSDAQQTLAIATADATNPRIDRVVARLSRVSNTISLVVITGTAAASPSAPAVNASSSDLWDLKLAQVRVDAGVVTIAANKITDERAWANAISDAANETATHASNDTTTASVGSPADMLGMSDTVNTSGGDLDVDFSGYLSHATLDAGISLFAKVDTTSIGIISITQPRANTLIQVAGFARFTGLAAGAHTVKITWGTSSGTAIVGGGRWMRAREVRR